MSTPKQNTKLKIEEEHKFPTMCNLSVLKDHGYTLVNKHENMILVKNEGGDLFVIKKLKANQDDLSHFVRQLNHPHIVRHKEVIRSPDCQYLVLEHCEGGDLAQKIKHKVQAKASFSENEILDWTVKICKALKYLHGQKILHKNLQPKSVFFTACGTIRLGKFWAINEWCTEVQTETESLAYIAPENLSGKPYDEKSEIWSLGCVIYEMCMLKCAYTGRSRDEIRNCFYEALPTIFSEDLHQLVKDTLQKDPAKRPSVSEILMKLFSIKHLYEKSTQIIEDFNATRNELRTLAEGLETVHFEKTRRQKGHFSLCCGCLFSSSI